MVCRPERAYRIADSRHPIFDGTGAFVAGGRWNSAGRRFVYAADSFAAAMLEILVHAGIGRLPRTQRWIDIVIPGGVSFAIAAMDDLAGWDLEDSAVARETGDRWYDEGRSLILSVPSVVTGGLSQNLLLNQNHPEFALLEASEPREVLWDRRLFPAAPRQR